MRLRDLRPALLLLVVLGAGGCDAWYNDVPSPDDLMHRIPWFDHMIVQKSVHAYSRADVPRYTPEGTVPITGGEADWLAEWSTGKTLTADRLVNVTKGGTPSPRQRREDGPETPKLPADLAARGDTLFHTYCAVCHGPAGALGGPVSAKIGAPSLVTARARGYSDGYLYSIIRYGRGVMPRYGDKIHDPIERWTVVNYVRKLQAEAPLQPTAPGGKN